MFDEGPREEWLTSAIERGGRGWDRGVSDERERVRERAVWMGRVNERVVCDSDD